MVAVGEGNYCDVKAGRIWSMYKAAKHIIFYNYEVFCLFILNLI